MNYKTVYIRIIANAKREESFGFRKEGYYERHHILPKSLYPLWTKRKSNIVKLTAREHLFVHMLLTKIYPKSHEMWSALWYMSCKSKKEKSNYPKLSLREYEKIKIGYAKSNSEHLKGKKNPNMVRSFSKETKLLIGEKSKGNTNVRGKTWWTKDGESMMATECPGEGWVRGRNTKGKDAWNKGLPLAEEAKRKISESKKDKASKMTLEERKRLYGHSHNAWNKGLKMSDDFIEKCKLREERKRLNEN